MTVYKAKRADGTSDAWIVTVDDGGWADRIAYSGLTRIEAEGLADRLNGKPTRDTRSSA